MVVDAPFLFPVNSRVEFLYPRRSRSQLLGTTCETIPHHVISLRFKVTSQPPEGVEDCQLNGMIGVCIHTITIN